MRLVCESPSGVVESRDEDGGWYDAYECNGSEHSMSGDERMILRQAPKAIAHSVVLHCRKIEALQIGQQEAVAIRVPCAITDIHRATVVCAAARSGQASIT